MKVMKLWLVWILLLPFLYMAAALPPGFKDELVTHWIRIPIGVASAPKLDGSAGHFLLINDFEGYLYLMPDADNSLNAQLLLDLTATMCTNGERGIQSVVVHPNFVENRFIYIYYTYNTGNGCHEHAIWGPVNRCSRFQMNEDYSIDPASEKVLFQSPPLETDHHNAGALAFGVDGHLYITTGDAGSPNPVSQNLTDLLGCVIRITDDGDIPIDNPFVDGVRCHQEGRVPSGSPANSVCAEIYAYGFRNPSRFGVDPNSKDKVRIFVQDVGASHWEEISMVGTDTGGKDYGWPAREGPCTKDSYSNCSFDANYKDPIYWYAHNSEISESKGSGAAVGGAFVPNGVWPEEYDGTYFFADFVYRAIYWLRPNGKTCRTCLPPIPSWTNTTFATFDRPVVSVDFMPYKNTMALYYTLFRGQVRRIIYTGITNYVEAVLVVSTDDASVDQVVTFDATNSSSAEDQNLYYLWDFGDGTVMGGDVVRTHQYSSRSVYQVKMTVRDGRGGEDIAYHEIAVGGRPTAAIISPSESTTFAVGDKLFLQGSAQDFSGNSLPASSLSWEVKQWHGEGLGRHYHPFFFSSGNEIVLQPAPDPEDLEAATNSYLEVILTATDDDGVSTTVSHSILPNRVWLDFDTDPSGLQITLDETFVTMPARVLSWENHKLRVIAPDQGNYLFDSWSHGGCQQHTIQVPVNGSCTPKYTAVFEDLSLVSERGQVQACDSAVSKNESSCEPNAAARSVPSTTPSSQLDGNPSALPSLFPSRVASDLPSQIPSDYPSRVPSDMPSCVPSDFPSQVPSDSPSQIPSDVPSRVPSDLPSQVPSDLPSKVPSFSEANLDAI